MLSDRQAATVWLRSDVERKRLVGLAPRASSRSSLDGGIYSHEATVRTYGSLADWTRWALRSGWSVVVDATFAEHGQRDAFRSLATECEADFGILACVVPESELRARVVSRRGDASEAGLEVLERQLATFTPLGEDELRECVPLAAGATDLDDITKPPTP
jgi:predicted kinase